MVTPEELAAFDCLIWLRTGQAASERLHCNQSTISRQVRRVAATFELSTQRVAHEWVVSGNTSLLALEREVHQLRRLLLGQGLRLEADAWPGRALATPLPPGWQAGTFDRLGPRHPLELLEQRVADAWLTLHRAELPPAEASSPWLTLPLASMPWQLMAHPEHPLAGQAGLTAGDLAAFPGPALPQGQLPQLERALQATALAHEPLGSSPLFREEAWCGRTQDRRSSCYATELATLCNNTLVRLDFPVAARAELALVVRRDIAGHGPIQTLVQTLRQRAAALAPQLPSLELCPA